MAGSWKPGDHSTVAPYLVVEGAQRVVDFATAVFDATELRRYDADDGTIVHVELKIGDSVVMVGDASEEWPVRTGFLHVYVEDVDATWEKALEAGATAIQEPVRKGDDPDRRGGVLDPVGNTWWIATQVA